MLTSRSTTPGPRDANRRWISDDYFDLIIWHDSENQIEGFQLCYDKPGYERALTWTQDQGFLHTAVDGGECKPTANRTPILVADGAFPVDVVRREFTHRSILLPADIRDLVLQRIGEYGNRQSA